MYKLLGRKQLRRPDEIIQPGEEFEPTEAELRSFGDKLAKVETSEPAHDDVKVPDEKEDEEQRTCAGNDGECSRTVADGEDYCWQHK